MLRTYFHWDDMGLVWYCEKKIRRTKTRTWDYSMVLPVDWIVGGRNLSLREEKCM
jgi:hypothetical protein